MLQKREWERDKDKDKDMELRPSGWDEWMWRVDSELPECGKRSR